MPMRITLAVLVISLAHPCLAYMSTTSTGAGMMRHATPTKSTMRHVAPTASSGFPSLNINKSFGIENEYQLNSGRAIDTLRRDYPHILTAEPDFSMFVDGIRLSDSNNKRTLQGLAAYTRVFEVLRFMRNTTMVHDEVGVRTVVSDGTIRVRWHAKLTMNDPFGALPGMTTRDETGRPVVFVDGVSAYELNDRGFIFSHRLEDVEVTPPELQPAVDLALFAWPGGLSPAPVAAVPSLSVRHGSTAMSLLETVTTDMEEELRAPRISSAVAATPLRRSRPSEVRSPAPVATAGETPMERAARERAEDAELAMRRRELRSTPAAAGERGFLSNFFDAAFSPQACESNYDCEDPLVCCDLVVASICCSSGMMIGPPAPRGPQLQGQAIPIPIPVDDDNNWPLPPQGGNEPYGR